jgi:hypothetical protein
MRYLILFRPIINIWVRYYDLETIMTQTTLKGINYVTYFKDYVTFSEVNRIIIVSQFFFKT